MTVVSIVEVALEALAGTPAAVPSLLRDEYPTNLTLREARERYFAQNGFGPDGGYGAAWVDFKLGALPFPFPNTAARVAAVKYHDLHHIVTGYRTNFIGELEISAWEIGAGCERMVAAWVLNLGGMAMGFLLAPRRTFRAFVRGRRGHTLYRRTFDDTLLSTTVGDIRREVGADAGDGARGTATDVALAVVWAHIGWLVGTLLSCVLLPLVPVGIVVGNLARRAAR